jgi:hypothetical protein
MLSVMLTYIISPLPPKNKNLFAATSLSESIPSKPTVADMNSSMKLYMVSHPDPMFSQDENANHIGKVAYRNIKQQWYFTICFNQYIPCNAKELICIRL